MIKIVHVIEDAHGRPDTAGTINLCRILANAQSLERSYEVHVVTNIPNFNEYVTNTVNIHYYQCRTKQVTRELLDEAVRVYHENDCDIIHVHLAKLGAIRYISRISDDKSIKIVYTVHNLVNVGMPSYSVLEYAKDINNKDNVVIVGPSKWSNHEWEYYTGATDVSNLKYVYNGINFTDIVPKNYNDRKYDLVICGRLVEMKNTKHCIEFVRDYCKDLKVLYIGDTDKSTSTRAHNYTLECESMMNELVENNPNVTWYRTVPNSDIINYFNNSKVMLSLGLETFGLIVAEAMSAGTIILAHDKGAVKELVTEDTGKIVNLPNRKLWKTKYSVLNESLRGILDNIDRYYPDEIRAHSITNFNTNLMVHNYNTIYTKLVNRKR